jgi:hypothetical protein
MSTYNLLRLRCGLSQAEAAALHRVRPDTVKSWCSGRNTASASVLLELQALHQKITDQAKLAARNIARNRPDLDNLETFYQITTQQQARSAGWPALGAYNAFIGEILAQLPNPDCVEWASADNLLCLYAISGAGNKIKV